MIATRTRAIQTPVDCGLSLRHPTATAATAAGWHQSYTAGGRHRNYSGSANVDCEELETPVAVGRVEKAPVENLSK
jgi:hypothetical protein